jgi:hypothetical protein
VPRGGEHLPVAGCQLADRPVGAEQQPRHAEPPDGLPDVRREVRVGPPVPVRLRIQAGQLAPYVGQGSELGETPPPQRGSADRDPRLSAATARTVAAELTARGALAAHLDAELHIDPDDIPSPVQAAAASALSFTSGALLPLLAILLPPAALRVPVTFAAVLIALGLAGALSARLGGSNIRRAVLRVVIGGALGLAFTYGIGHLFGTAIG